MEPKQTTSAGGVIVKIISGKPHILLIRDRAYADWVLPKGHVEEEETIEEAALREVQEEAGLRHVKIIQLLGTYTRHVEKTGEDKTIHYFLMAPTQDEKPSITKDNSEDEIAWHPLDALPNFYLPEQKYVIEKNLQIIANSAKENSPAEKTRE
jgi:ADP-ribose pyrophosphatase YjhB (NUDIX family)